MMRRPVCPVDVERLLSDVWSSDPAMAEQQTVESGRKQAASAIADAIDRNWLGTQADLARAAGCSERALSHLRNHGFERITKTVKSLCRVLGVDPVALHEGVIRPMASPSGKPTVTELAQRLVGHPRQAFAEKMLAAILDDQAGT